MTNEEVIRMLTRIKDQLNWEWTDAQKKMDALNIAIKVLMAQQWIPCSERLPKWSEHVDDMVLICDSDGHVRFDTLWHNGTWVSCPRVVAWMPLPKPYKEGNDGTM